MRWRRPLKKFGSRYTQRLFLNSEIDSFEKNPTTTPVDYATCLAAKEPVLKILGVRENVPSWKAT
jgi:phosphopantetheinyl transferase (holo-ACP synthase)